MRSPDAPTRVTHIISCCYAGATIPRQRYKSAAGVAKNCSMALQWSLFSVYICGTAVVTVQRLYLCTLVVSPTSRERSQTPALGPLATIHVTRKRQMSPNHRSRLRSGTCPWTWTCATAGARGVCLRNGTRVRRIQRDSG